MERLVCIRKMVLRMERTLQSREWKENFMTQRRRKSERGLMSKNETFARKEKRNQKSISL